VNLDVPTEPNLDPRARILCAALDGFLRQGYHGTSTLDIASRARVSKRDLYAQFGSKQGILAAAITERTQRMQLPLSLPTPRDRTGLAAMLVRFGAALLREVSRPEVLALYRLAIAESDRSPDLARTLDAAGRGAMHATLVDLLARAQGAGLVGADDPDDMAGRFVALLWGSLLIRLLLGIAAAPDTAETERRAQAAADTLLRLYPAADINGKP
jgi:AcrR family transcriptional regulator